MKFKHYFRNENGRIYGADHAGTFGEMEKLTRAEGERLYRAQACADLRDILKPGDKVYTLLRSVSASGMTRRISVLAAVMEEQTGADGKCRRVPTIRDLSFMVATALGYSQHDETGAVVVGGCGMDMGFHVVYSLGSRLWPEGTKKPNGGYALRHEWL